MIADDILVYGSGDTTGQAIRDHDDNLTAVLERARRRGLKLKFCRSNSVNFNSQILSFDSFCTRFQPKCYPIGFSQHSRVISTISISFCRFVLPLGFTFKFEFASR